MNFYKPYNSLLMKDINGIIDDICQLIFNNPSNKFKLLDNETFDDQSEDYKKYIRVVMIPVVYFPIHKYGLKSYDIDKDNMILMGAKKLHAATFFKNHEKFEDEDENYKNNCIENARIALDFCIPKFIKMNNS